MGRSSQLSLGSFFLERRELLQYSEYGNGSFFGTKDVIDAALALLYNESILQNKRK
jgi:hypothetical protein